MKTHLHFICWGYTRVEEGTGNYIENTIVDIISTGEKAALARAKGLVSKPNWVIRTIVEHFDGQPCSKG